MSPVPNFVDCKICKELHFVGDKQKPAWECVILQLGLMISETMVVGRGVFPEMSCE